GVDAVLANAAVISVGAHDRDTIVRTNVEGTRNVMLAMADAGVRRAVYTSTATVYAPRADHTYREDDPLRDPAARGHRFNWYAISKSAAEQAAWELATAHQIALTAIRPHAIHGAWDEHGATAWLRRMTGLPVGAWLAGTRFPSVYAGDLADAVCAALERPVAAGRAYNIAGEPGAHTFWDLLRAWREAGGDTARIVLPIPAPMARRYVIDRARDELGFTNRPLVEGLRESLALERSGAL
ncbi:MAG TPA: NAD(P)-dependent oxidoreductase, partial [Myxococcota bacterium]|nr:NAD(P)-dependent oxidoreductase [Myxococcota bacterium]